MNESYKNSQCLNGTIPIEGTKMGTIPTSTIPLVGIATCQHCLTCSDEALSVKVVGIDQEIGLAQVEVGDQAEEVDITLVENVVQGDILLVHGGVAVARLEGEGADGR